MEESIIEYRKNIEKSQIFNLKKISNLRNEFINIKSQLNRIFNIYNDTPDHILSQIEHIKSYQKDLIEIISSNTPFRIIIDNYRNNHCLDNKPYLENDEEVDEELLSVKQHGYHSKYVHNIMCDTVVSKILRSLLSIVTDHLNMINDGGLVANDLFQVIEDSINELPLPRISISNDLVFMSNVAEIKSFLYSMLSGAVNKQRVIELTLLLYTKLGGLESFLEWLISIIDQRLLKDIAVRTEILYMVLKSLLVGNGSLTNEIRGHIEDCLGMVIPEKVSVNLEEGINILFTAILRLCKIEKSFNNELTDDKRVVNETPFTDIYVWSYGHEIDFIKSAYPDSLTTRLNVSSERPSNKQIICTQKQLIMVNNFGQVRSLSISKRNSKDSSFKTMLNACWSPIQFPDPNIKIDYVCVGYRSDNEKQHILALTRSGQIFSWGGGNYGKLGHGDISDVKSPKLISSLRGYVVKQISVGINHSAAVTETGLSFIWGNNLSFNDESEDQCLIPKRLKQGIMSNIICGPQCTFLVGINMRDVTYMGASQSDVFCYQEHFVLPIHPCPIKWVSFEGPKKIYDSNFEKIQKIVINSTGILVLLVNGHLYSLGHGLILGCPNCTMHECFERVTTMLDVQVLDVAVSETHVIVLAKNVVYSWTLMATTLTIFEEYLPYPVTNVCATYLIHDNRQINIAWCKKEEGPNRCLQNKQHNPYLYTSCVSTTITNFTNLLIKCMKDYELSPFFEQVTQNLLDLLLYCLKSDRFNSSSVESITFEVVKSFMDTLLGIYEKVKMNMDIIEVMNAVILTSSKVFYKNLEHRADCISSLLSSVTSLSSLKDGEKVFLEALLFSFEDQNQMCQFKKLYKLKLKILDELLITACRVLTSDLMSLVQEHLNAKRSSIPHCLSLSPLAITLNTFVTSGYRIFLKRIKKFKPNVHNPLQNLCSLLPMINIVIYCFKSYLYGNYKIGQWIGTSEAKSVNVLFSKTSMGWILFDVLFFLFEEDHHEDVCSLIPHISSMIISLNEINIILPHSINNEAQEIYFPLYGFSSPNSPLCSIPESSADWVWIMDVQRMSGLLYGKLLNKIITSVASDEDERMVYWLETPLFKYLFQLDQRRKTNEKMHLRNEDDFDRTLRFFLFKDFEKNRLWTKDNILHKLGVEIYSTIVDLISSKWYQVNPEDILPLHAIPYVLEKVLNSVNDSILKFMDNSQFSDNCSWTEDQRTLFQIYTKSVNDKCLFLRDLMNESEKNIEISSKNDNIFQEHCNISKIIDALDLQYSKKGTVKHCGRRSKSVDFTNDVSSDVISTRNIASMRWIKNIYPSLIDFLKPDHLMQVTDELQKISFSFLVKRTKYSRAMTAVQGISKVLSSSVKLLDSVFLQIINGLIESVKIVQPRKSFTDDQVLILDTIFTVVIEKLKICIARNSYTNIPQRLCASIFSLICQYNFINFVLEENICGLILEIVADKPLVITNDWLIIEGNGDHNLTDTCNMVSWCTLESLMLNMSLHMSHISENLKSKMEDQILSFVESVYDQITKNIFLKIFDLYAFLNLFKFLYVKKVFFRQKDSLTRWTDILLKIATIEKEDDCFYIFYSKYAINVSALDFLAIITADMNETSYNQLMNDIFGKTMKRFAQFYSYLLTTVPILQTKRIISAIECRMNYFSDIESIECNKDTANNWIYGNGNFDRERTFFCDVINCDTISVTTSSIDQFLAVNLETIVSGVWQVTIDVSCPDNKVELSCGFLINDSDFWPEGFKSLMNLKKIIQHISISGKGCLSHRIDCVIDIDEGLVYFYNVFNRVQTFNDRDVKFKFFLSFPPKSQHMTSTQQIHLVHIRQRLHSNIHEINKFYNNSAICHDNYSVRSKLYSTITKWCDGRPDLLFKFVILPLSEQLTSCYHVDYYLDKKITDPVASVTILFSLFLLCGISRQYSFYRGEICTYLSLEDDGEHIGIIMDFETGVRSKFAGLNFVQKIVDNCDINCIIHSLSFNCPLKLPLKNLIKDEIFDETILSRYFKDVFPDNIENIICLLVNLSKCVSLKYFDFDVTNYENIPWPSNSVNTVVAEYHLMKFLSSDLFLQIIDRDEVLEWFSIPRKNEIGKNMERIFQNLIEVASKACPMKFVSNSKNFLSCSLRLFEGFTVMASEINENVAKKYAKLFLTSNQRVDLGGYLCKGERRLLLLALRRPGYSKELIDNFINNSSNQLSTIDCGPVTFSLRRRLLDSSVSTDYGNMPQIIPAPANEYDIHANEAVQIQEVDTFETDQHNQNRLHRQTLIQDFFTIQNQKKKTFRVCPICELILKTDNDSLFTHLSFKHSHNCRKSFQHQATKGVDIDGGYHNLDLKTVLCATVTDRLYCVCSEYLEKRIPNKEGQQSQTNYEHFINEHYEKNPLIGWSGVLTSENYFYQKKLEVKIYQMIKIPEIEEVSILGENIIIESDDLETSFNSNELEISQKNVCDEVYFVCQMNSSAIIKAFVRLEYANTVLSSRKILLRLIKLIYERKLGNNVNSVFQKCLLTDVSFICDIVKLVEYDRIYFEHLSITSDIQTIKFGKKYFLTTLISMFESSLDNSEKIHRFFRTLIGILENLFTSTQEYFGLNRDSDKTVLMCPSRLLSQIFFNMTLRILDTMIVKKISYEYWQEDIEDIIDVLAFGFINNICCARDKVWCLHNIIKLFYLIKKRKMDEDINIINQADIFNDLSTDDLQVVHLSNPNIKKLISTSNRQYMLTSDFEGTLRIWDIDSKIELCQHLQQTLHFSIDNRENRNEDENECCSDSIGDSQASDVLKNYVSNYIMEIEVQNVAISFSGLYIAESVGVYLNIWSTKSVYSHPKLITFTSIIKALVFPELTFNGIYGAPIDQLLVGLSDGQMILLRMFDNGARITQKNIKTITEGNISISTAAWDNERNPIVIGYDDGSIVLTDQNLDTDLKILETIHNNKISKLLYSPDPSKFGQNLLASCSVNEPWIAIWNLDRLLCVISLSSSVTCMEWLSRSCVPITDTFRIITGNSNGVIQFWDFDESGNQLNNTMSFHGHECDIIVLKMCDKTCLLASGCKNGLVNVWSMKDKNLLRSFRGDNSVVSAEWTLNNNLVVAWSKAQYINVWNNFNDVAFQKNGLRQWAHLRTMFLQYGNVRSIKHLSNLKMLALSINRLILQQHNDEASFIRCGYSIVYSKYLQTLVQFVFSLDLLPTFIPCLKSEYFAQSLLQNEPIHRELTGESNCKRRTLCYILNRNERLSRFSDSFLDWLFDIDEVIQTTTEISFQEEHSKEVIPKWWWNWCFESNEFIHNYVEAKWQNRYWSWDMQRELHEWYQDYPSEWISNYNASTFLWGCGKKGELNMITKRDWENPSKVKVDGVQQVVCGSALTLVLMVDGTLMACGEGLEIVLNPYLREESSRIITVPVLSDFKITQVSASRGPESHIIAITAYGEAYSWGVGSHGKLGHGHNTSLKKPKLIEGLRGKNPIQGDCGHMHSAIVTESGKLYTFGLGVQGQLGIKNNTGSDIPRQVIFKEDDVKIGSVACGSNHTLALTQNGSCLYAFGDGAFGKLGVGDVDKRMIPTSVDLKKSILLKIVCGDNFSAALTDRGNILSWGHKDFLGFTVPDDGINMDNYVTVPTLNNNFVNQSLTISDISAGNDVIFAVTSSGLIYGWGSNNNNLLLEATRTHVYLPEIIEIDKNTKFKQISCGRHHVSVSSYSPHSFRHDIPTGPQLIHETNDHFDKSRYPVLSASDLNRFDLTARLVVILYWNELVRLTWQMWLPLPDIKYSQSDNSSKQLEPEEESCSIVSSQSNSLFEVDSVFKPFDNFRRGRVRSLLNKKAINNDIYRYISGSMITNRTYGSLIKINRIEKTESVFLQTCHQVLKMHPMELRLPWRAWKVKLVHEGADDAGGAYDETISEICNELQSSDHDICLLISSPSDNTLYLPNPNPNICSKYFHFLGILMATAIRTKKPINLSLDPLFWKLMTKSCLTVEDLRLLDPAYFNSLLSSTNAENGEESYLKEVLSVDKFVAFSANKGEYEIIYNGREKTVNCANLPYFVQQVINFRLHEFDNCVKHIRKGFEGVSPLLFLDLMTWDSLENAVCGSRTIDISVLKSISRYVDADENNEIFSWFWDTLEQFTEKEKSLFLRFVTGKSRLPSENSKIPFRLFIYFSKQPPSSLPQAQTCFNQIRLPRYTSKAELDSRLRIAINQCRSIDMDDYMLVRNRDT